jgi:hypothetical protein
MDVLETNFNGSVMYVNVNIFLFWFDFDAWKKQLNDIVRLLMKVYPVGIDL